MKTTFFKQTLGVLALGTLALATSVAHADWDRGHGERHGPGNWDGYYFGQQVNERQANQMTRIQTGMRQGLLTRAEYHALMHEQERIRDMERHFRADGYLDRFEFERLQRVLDVASRNIRLENRDRQVRHDRGDYGRFN
jgi:hypothetical protein